MAVKRVTNRTRATCNLNGKRRRMAGVLNRLGEEFKPWHGYTDDPFLELVGTVLSQNTSGKNTEVAYNRLTSKFNTPEQFMRADMREIQNLIKPAGLHRIKSRRLKQLARIVCERYHGDIGTVLRRPPEEARRELLSFPGVGYKTADVMLLFAARRDVLPVDTHVFRIAKRLGLASPENDHEEVKAKLEEVTPSGRRGEAHMLLIQHGRRYCRARNPLCKVCPINDLCPKVRVKIEGHARS